MCLADEECADFEVKCGGLSPTASCVDQDLMCDGEDDCGNNWDEHPQTCGQFYYRTMLYSAKRGFAIACRPSVRLSVCL